MKRICCGHTNLECDVGDRQNEAVHLRQILCFGRPPASLNSKQNLLRDPVVLSRRTQLSQSLLPAIHIAASPYGDLQECPEVKCDERIPPMREDL